MTSFPIQYFLGSNSPQGFYPIYDQLIDLKQASRVYILKGGPGCGKSTLMRRAAQSAADAGQPVELILCSGDPDSLDAVIFPRLRAAITDGTAPHVVEPSYPGVVEQYVNLGTCYDHRGLAGVKEDIFSCRKEYKDSYVSAYRYLGAAGQVLEELRFPLESPALSDKLTRRAQGILSRELPRQKGAGPGRVTVRFLTAVTHKGPVFLTSTVQTQCSRIFELQDRYGLAHPLVSALTRGAVERGYDIISCPDPLFPHRLAHLLVPQAGVAFLSSTPTIPYSGPAHRRIRVDRAADQGVLKRCRPRLRAAQRMAADLMQEGILYLGQAHARHDDLEEYYNPYIDFSANETVIQTILRELFPE